MVRQPRGTQVGLRLILSGVVMLAGCGPGAESLPTSSTYATAAAACSALAGEGWQVAVELDHPTSSALALVSGDQIAPCLTARLDDGRFGDTSLGGSLAPAPSPPALSFVTGMLSGTERILIGRVPPATRSVRLTLEDGSDQPVSIGGGLWLAWLTDGSAATLIEALDQSGATIARIADPNGIEPGAQGGSAPTPVGT